MALFSKADLSKSKYIVSIIAKIKQGDKIKVSDGKSYLFKKTKDINNLEKVQTDVQKYTKILLVNNNHTSIFTDGKKSFRFIDIDKSPFSGMGGGTSRNVLGKQLSDAGELATVMSLRKDIKNARDTGQSIFVNNPEAFAAWYTTFQYTRPAVNKIVGSLNNFDIIHDATDKSDFTNTITLFLRKAKLSKDSWNPADIYIINKSIRQKVTNDLKKIVETYEISDGLVNMFNNKLYEFYKKKILYPISLKQLVTEKPSIDYANIPGTVNVEAYNIKISKFNCNLTTEGKEIGLFTFLNVDTRKQINLQVRGFPHSYGVAQTEITSDGTPSGGRLGKISTSIVDSVMAQYNDARINSIKYFGTPRPFENFDESKIRETYKMYETVIKNSKVSNQKFLKYNDYVKLINTSKSNVEIAKNMCMKIQGLKIMHFFIKNEKNLSGIMNKMINGAKKISDANGFFIKIY
jgi:hypothetical protein